MKLKKEYENNKLVIIRKVNGRNLKFDVNKSDYFKTIKEFSDLFEPNKPRRSAKKKEIEFEGILEENEVKEEYKPILTEYGCYCHIAESCEKCKKA